MAIQETSRKIHFRPYSPAKGRPEDTDPAPTVSVNTNNSYLLFSRGLVNGTQMDKKFIRLYYEPTKKIIGWQLRDKLEHEKMKSWKLVRPSKQGTYSISIKKMLTEFTGIEGKNFPALPVKKYRELGALDEQRPNTPLSIRRRGMSRPNAHRERMYTKHED